jgi:3-dehydroquinate synthase
MSHTLRVETEPPYDVQVGEDLLGRVAGFVSRYSAVAVVSDENVSPLYLSRLGELAKGTVVRVRPGEASKSFATLERVLNELIAAKLGRDACLVALGGGVIGDLCGLAAALYKRGVDFVQCPTSLLAQVDASVGGKTAVNLPLGKNLAGVFQQPLAVFADVTTLATLPEHEYVSGLGEVLKSALLAGEDDLAALEASAVELVDREPEALEGAVLRSVALKARVVAEDPRELGPRKQLNLGHTFGHAIEHIAGFGVVPHGVAVAAGIGMAMEHASKLGVLQDGALPERVAQLSRQLGLPASLLDLEERFDLAFPEAQLVESMGFDKKNDGGEVRLVLPVRAGEVAVDAHFGGF